MHVNRVLQAMARDRLVKRERRFIRVLDGRRLREASDFDPLYLHAPREKLAA